MADKLPHEIIWHIISYVRSDNILSWCTIDKKTYSVTNKEIIDKCIYNNYEDTLLMYQALSGVTNLFENMGFRQLMYNILSRDLTRGNIYDVSFILLKQFYARYDFVNVLFNEGLALWSPSFPTWSFEKNKEHWIAKIKLFEGNRVFTYNQPCWTLAKIIQNMTMQMRTVIDKCNSVRVVGAPYMNGDDTPPTPMEALCYLKVYCKWCDVVPVKYGPKRRAAQGLKHIPTEYINRYTKEIRKSFHARQCMDLNQGSHCQVRLKFAVYQDRRQPWLWYLRVLFDKIKIYKTT